MVEVTLALLDAATSSSANGGANASVHHGNPAGDDGGSSR